MKVYQETQYLNNLKLFAHLYCIYIWPNDLAKLAEFLEEPMKTFIVRYFFKVFLKFHRQRRALQLVFDYKK